MYLKITKAMHHKSVADSRIGTLLTGFLCLLLALPACAEVRAHLDRSKIYVGDPVTLVIESTGASSGDPDLSPLNRDFRVLGTGTSTQFSFSNGRSSNRTTWTVQLGPLQTGKLQIPPIQVGAEQTKALELEVTEVPEQLAAQQSEHLFLEAEADTDSAAYVQQQIPYTLRLYHDDTLINGDLRPPQVRDALIRQLGDERRYSVTRNNRRYQVVERRYAVSPEKSGELHIPPATFSGQISTTKQSPGPGGSSRPDRLMQQFLRNSPFSGGGRSVRAHSKAITIDVLPPPVGVGNDWLPAENLELHDSWANNPPQLRAGEPVSRTISLRATGLAGMQIPALQLEQPQGTRVYPETPVNESRTDGDKVYAVSKQTFTYIPGQSGELSIPAVELPWWNTQSNEQATARLPEWIIQVAPGIAGTQAPSNEAPVEDTRTAVPERQAGIDPQVSGESWFAQLKPFPWSWLLLVLLVSSAAFLAKRWLSGAARRVAEVRSDAPAEPVDHTPGVDDLMPRLQRACERNDAQQAAQALLELGHARWPDDPPRSLGQLGARLGHGQEHIKMLDRVLYAADASSWNGADLWASTKGAWKRQPGSRKPNDEDLEPLYPQNGC